MERQLRRSKPRLNIHSDTGIVVRLADDLGGCCVSDKLDAVLGGWLDRKNGADQLQHRLGVVCEVDAGEVDVLGRSPRVERGKQHSSFEDETLPDITDGQPGEEPFENVQLQQFLGESAGAASLAQEVEVGIVRRRTSRYAAHSKISNVSRSAVRIRGNDRAMPSNSEGCPPRRSHRLSASLAMSAPSMWRIRKASRMLRSAE